MGASMLRATLYTPDYVKLGVLPLLGGTVILRRNHISTFVLDVDGNHHGWVRYRKGHRVVISDDTGQLLAGQISKVGKSYSGGLRSVTLTGSSDMVWLAQRVTYPNPDQHPESQSEGYYKRSGNAETLILDLVRRNAGPAARVERRATLQLDSDQSRGGTVTLNSRFKNLLEEVHELASAGNVTFETRQENGTTVFGLRDQRDLTRHIRLSPTNGGVISYDLEETAPDVTHVLVAGQGEGEARTIKLVSGNQSEWGVYAEEFKDQRHTDDTAELLQAGRERIEEGAASSSVTLTIGDTPRRVFGEHYFLGDLITVSLGVDGRVQDTVQMAEISFSPQGRAVKLQVGPRLDETDAPGWVTAIDFMLRDVRVLQRT